MNKFTKAALARVKEEAALAGLADQINDAAFNIKFGLRHKDSERVEKAHADLEMALAAFTLALFGEIK